MELSPYSNRQSPDKIWFVCRERGDSPVRRLIDRLDDRTRTETWRVFDWVETRGPLRGTDRFRNLSGHVVEFKVHRATPMRYLAFRCDVGWVVTYAVSKPGKRALQQLIRQSQWLCDEYERTRR